MSIALGGALARKSIADVTRRKGRTLVVVLSIFIGVFGLTGINVFEFKIFDAFAYQQDRSRYPDITFQVDSVDSAWVKQLASVPNVWMLQTRLEGKFQWQTASKPIALNIIAFPDPNHVTLGSYDLVSGHLPGPGEIVLEVGNNALQPFSLNDVIEVNGPRGTTRLRVVGISRTAGLPIIKGTKIAQGYMSTDGLSQLLGTSTSNSIAVKVHDINTVQDTASRSQQFLM
jgi:hypothetical protein